jgi:aldehyde dehydrogenase (NAD+)
MTTTQLLRNNFNRGITRPLAYRQEQLNGIKRFITECEDKIITALHKDLRKSKAETVLTEIGFIASELKFTQKNLAQWMKKKRVRTTLIAQPGKSFIYPEPLGVVLIIAPWNYPIHLSLVPLIGALAAGNCVVLKPSEIAPATSTLLATELPKYIDPQCLAIVEGGVDTTTALLNETFDHIFYTGNGTVGRIIMTAAAKHLTPVTLELGGKSPCIVDEHTDLDVAARRIVWGKFSNAGQICTAPDYILAHQAIEKPLIEKMKKTLREFYSDNPQQSSDYGRVINERHYERLMNLIPNSGDVVTGGHGDKTDCYIAPTILSNVKQDAAVMLDEIFGPILPVISVKDMDAAISFINARPKPLTLYIFTSDRTTRERIIAETSSGSVCVNFPLAQVSVHDLPFGGVGASGMGAYHGKSSFDTFTHFKSVLIKPTWLNPKIFFPPYGEGFMRLIRWLMW